MCVLVQADIHQLIALTTRVMALIINHQMYAVAMAPVLPTIYVFVGTVLLVVTARNLLVARCKIYNSQQEILLHCRHPIMLSNQLLHLPAFAA